MSNMNFFYIGNYISLIAGACWHTRFVNVNVATADRGMLSILSRSRLQLDFSKYAPPQEIQYIPVLFSPLSTKWAPMEYFKFSLKLKQDNVGKSNRK